MLHRFDYMMDIFFHQKLQIKEKLYYKEQKNPVLNLYWEPAEGKKEGPVQKISIFTIVTCLLQPGELPLQWMVRMS